MNLRSASSGSSVRLLLDTQILVWMINGDRRLRRTWQDAMTAPDAELQISAVVAFEFTELQLRGRLPVDESISELEDRFDLQIVAFPAGGWDILRSLPSIHRDPVDRMLVSHGLLEGAALVTADANIRRYPRPCI